jgi:hypothetical protein
MTKTRIESDLISLIEKTCTKDKLIVNRILNDYGLL